MRTSTMMTLMVVMVSGVLLLHSTAHGQAIIYVDGDASTNGDGIDWTTAYRYLQDALAAAGTNGVTTEIRVAQGTYEPDQDEGGNVTPGVRTETFQLLNGVELKGGYAGLGAPDPDLRDIDGNTSILSGDIGVAGTNGDNSYHVVTGSSVDSNGILDGFTITGGHANGSYPNNTGAGMHSDSGSAGVRNCTFSGNTAEYGGAMANDHSNPTLTGCTLSGNSATDDGGGMFNAHNSGPVLIGCTITGNSADDDGGGMFNRECGPPTLVNCTFSGNSAVHLGGGIHNYECGSQLLTDCTFNGNWAGSGGGMANDHFSSPTLANCIFSGNSASYDGGGMYNHYRSSPTLANCIFSGNLADGGGGMYNDSICSPTLANCTFSGNSASAGGAMRNYNSTPTLANCILWDGGDEVSNEGNSVAAITYSDVQGGWPGNGNISEDPLFVDSNGLDGIPGTEDDNLRLLSGSPCIDAGSNGALPPDTVDLDGDGDSTEPIPIDLDGHARILCGMVDMGAYEFGIGNYNCDQAIDLADFAWWDACMTGPDAGPYAPGCEAFDFEFDGDVDLSDFAGFQRVFGIP